MSVKPGQAQRGWRDLKHVLDLRPVYHRKEERIRAHIVLCWLALLLIRIAETTTAQTWPRLHRELDCLHLGTFTGPPGCSANAARSPNRSVTSWPSSTSALDVSTGKVIGSIHRRHRATEFRKFFVQLDREAPPSWTCT
jgi:hypothetical protein